jgi:holliday junction DNA helicase RuvA
LIGRLNGRMAEKNPPFILIDVNGVGYEVQVPMSTFYDLPEIGQPLQLLTHLIVREDAHLLFGFLRASERESFLQLIRISGVGPRTALALLSGLSPDELAAAVALQDATKLTRVPGIGKKTAERLILELKGKLGQALVQGAGIPNVNMPPDSMHDVLQALLALGYSDKEAQSATRALPPGLSVSDGIKQALKGLAR